MPQAYSCPSISLTRSSNPQGYLRRPEDLEKVHEYLSRDDLRKAIVATFSLPEDDDYVYYANVGVSLAQAQRAVEAGTANKLCDWYLDEAMNSLGNPPKIDIDAYISTVSSTAPNNALKSLNANAKKNSIRSEVAANLLAKRHLDSRFSEYKPNRKKKRNPSKEGQQDPKHLDAIASNPYLEFWKWSCRVLNWGGPTRFASLRKASHAVLPIFMHHFGCVPPSEEALLLIKQVAYAAAARHNPEEGTRLSSANIKPASSTAPATICEIGSGTGYWTYLLRQRGLNVHAVDSGQSSFRTSWIDDTIIADGAIWLRGRQSTHSISPTPSTSEVLLLVYPIVGADFVRRMLAAFDGHDVCIVGTQDDSGYTAFTDRSINDFMAAEWPVYQKTAQIPLPSFAGKDDALFVFQKPSGTEETSQEALNGH